METIMMFIGDIFSESGRWLMAKTGWSMGTVIGVMIAFITALVSIIAHVRQKPHALTEEAVSESDGAEGIEKILNEQARGVLSPQQIAAVTAAMQGMDTNGAASSTTKTFSTVIINGQVVSSSHSSDSSAAWDEDDVQIQTDDRGAPVAINVDGQTIDLGDFAPSRQGSTND